FEFQGDFDPNKSQERVFNVTQEQITDWIGQKILDFNSSQGILSGSNMMVSGLKCNDINDRVDTVLEVADIFVGLGEGVLSFLKAYLEKNSERRASALLLWCQRKTIGYSNVKVVNFTKRGMNSLAFNALLHARRSLLDVEDVDAARSDENSVITCVSLCYHHFAEQKRKLTGASRVVNSWTKNDQIVADEMDHGRKTVEAEKSLKNRKLLQVIFLRGFVEKLLNTFINNEDH
ncbi:unnamed protein product, partial [Angiostrongylus costaricensis]|uniref:Calponin-homology (CH) domain-containing protein n=1 Tax=Angiostrongylus costaricensis TaxID=334426 RepID=A0A0R3PH91_ANGCS